MIPFVSRRSPVYVGTGGVANYAFSFKVFAAADITVLQTTGAGVESTLVLNTDYTVSLNADQDNFPGGSITLSANLPLDYTAVIIGNQAYSQTTQFPTGGPYNAVIHEQALDRVVVMAQQLKEISDRSLKFPSADATPSQLPAAAERANKALTFDDQGRPTVTATAANVQAAVDLALEYRNAAQTAQGLAEEAQEASEDARDLAQDYRDDALEARDAAQLIVAGVRFATKALMDADLAHAAGVFAFVYADPTAANNGLYYKIGGSGAGSWAPYQGDRVTIVSNKLDGIAANFTLLESDNIYDPNISDHYDNGVYNPVGSVSDLAQYHRSGLLAVTPGQSIVIDITNTPGKFAIYRPSGAKIHGYTASPPGVGTFHSLITATFSLGDRLAIFTVPVGVNFIAWNTYNAGGAAPTADEFAIMRAMTMVTVGAAQVDFAPYYPPNTYEPAPVLDESLPVRILKSASNLYIRQPFNDDYDLVRRVQFNTASSTVAGTIDFPGVRKVPVDTRTADLEENYNSATVFEYLHNALDNNPPEKFNGVFLGGGHGVPCFKLTKAAHGLANAAVGDVGVDGVGKSWVLVRIVDASNIQVVAANTGAADKWTVSGTPSGGTITFAGAGAYAYTASVGEQVWPAVQNYVTAIYVDDEEVTEDGAYAGQRISVVECYGIPNVAHWLSTLIAEKGTATPKNPSDASIQTQVEITSSWQFDRYGGMSGYRNKFAKQAYKRTGGSTDDYSADQQWQQIYRVLLAAYTLHQYVPDLAGSVGGYDLKNIADITANAANVTVAKADCIDPTNPASHFAQQIRNLGVPTFGFVMGYVRDRGLGVPATRAASVTNVFQLSSSEKQYPHSIDSGAGDAAAGESTSVVTFSGYYDMSANPTHTVNKLVELADGKVLWAFDVHAVLDAAWVEMPSELVGRPLEVLHNSGITLHTPEMVAAKGVRLSTPSGYGHIQALIG